ncbi:MAG: PIG-L family deacetylase [Desulfobacteraceae bacterium]|nr:MAG: PIG-L family deacetylase [Desulfobacteraceae bacterium]
MQYENIVTIHKTYTHVYIAPHLDDAAFSCSGLIARQVRDGEAVLVVTVFTADIEAEKKPHDPALKNVVDMSRRRAEDRKAMDEMGADFLWLDHQDWIFRHCHPIYRYSLSPGLLQGEQELTDRIASEIRAVCQKAGNRNLYIPLGVGQHADHQLVFQCSLGLARPVRPDLQIIYYEEIPYALFPALLSYRLMSLGQNPVQSREPDLLERLNIIQAGRTFRGQLREVPTLLGNNNWMRWLAYVAIWFFLLYSKIGMRPRKMGCLYGRILTARQMDIGPDVEKKFRAIRSYPSQIEQIRDYPEKMRQMLAGYAGMISSGAKTFAERYWFLEK